MKYRKELGFDVSEQNRKTYGDPDFKLMKELGATFCIVRSSFGKTFGQEDSLFLEYAYRAKEAGLKLGAYHYSYGLTKSDILNEVANCVNAIDKSGLLFELPIWFDMEDADGYKSRHGFYFDRRYITDLCKTWLDNFPYNTGIYAAQYWLQSYIEWKRLNCSVWSARFLPNSLVSRIAHSGNLELLNGEDDIGGFMFQFTEEYPLNNHHIDADIMYVPVAE